MSHPGDGAGFSEREILVAGPSFKWDDFQLATGNLSLFGAAKLGRIEKLHEHAVSVLVHGNLAHGDAAG